MRSYAPKHQVHEGFETWFNAFAMSWKMSKRIFLSLFLLHLLVFLVIVCIRFDDYTIRTSFQWILAKILSPLFPNGTMTFTNEDGTQAYISAYSMANSFKISQFAAYYLRKIRNVFLFCALIYLLYPLILYRFGKRSEKQSEIKHVRGSKLITAETFYRTATKIKDPLDLPIGQLKMPVSAEPKHTFIIGRPGTGKSVLMYQILERLKARGEKAIVYDFKGDYLSKFYDPREDLIFNPLDVRSLGWNLFNEIETFMDVDAMTASLIPNPISSSEPFWNEAARDVFAGILHYLHQGKYQNNSDIWEMVTSDGANIATCLKNTPGGERGYRYIEDASSKQAMSVFSVMMQYAKCFEYMAENDGDFNVKEWLEKGRGMIFITNYADVQDTLKPVLSLFIDLLGRKLLSMSDDSSRRIFFLLDEFGTLQRLSTLIKLLTLSRSKGGAVFLGIQDYGQLDKLYSRDHRQSIVNACGNSVIFSVADTVSARLSSEKIGETEYIDTEKTFSMGVMDYKDGTTISERKKKEFLFLPSDIMNLPDLTGIVKFSNYDPIQATFQYRPYPDTAESFQLRNDLLIKPPTADKEGPQNAA